MTDVPTLCAIRFGNGLPLPEGAPQDAVSVLARLAGPDLARGTWPSLTTAEAMKTQGRYAKAQSDLRQAGADAAEAKAARRGIRQELLGEAQRAVRMSLARAVGATDGMRERLVRFWVDHFTTVAKSPPHIGMVLAMAEDAIRPNVTGRFAQLLQAATLHPAMLLYLDQHRSVGPNSPQAKGGRRGLNENLARELIELHSLGVAGNYAQTDVRQMAELLTGLLFRSGQGTVYVERAAEPGPETVLGRVYDGEGTAPILAALEDLAMRPETARHLARKLAVHFVSDTPDAAMIDAMAVAYAQSGGELMALYRTMLLHASAWITPLGKARQPYDFIVASLRALGLDPARIAALSVQDLQHRLLRPMERMGQPLNQAPGPDGWPEEAEAWITPQGLGARITWAMDVPQRLLNVLPEPAALAERALGPLVGKDLRFAVQAAENRREGVGLVLASTEFNKR